MLSRYLPILGILFLFTLLLFVKSSRKRLWHEDKTRNSRMFTIRAVILIIVLLVFLFFSLIR